jgi:hypothetical protein
LGSNFCGVPRANRHLAQLGFNLGTKDILGLCLHNQNYTKRAAKIKLGGVCLATKLIHSNSQKAKAYKDISDRFCDTLECTAFMLLDNGIKTIMILSM